MVISPKISVYTDRGTRTMSVEIPQVEKFLGVGPGGEGFLGAGEGGGCTCCSETKAETID